MILADVFGWVFFIIGLMAVFNCYWLAAYSLWPLMVTRGSEIYGRPFRTTFTGLAVVLPGGLLGIALASQPLPPIKVLGIALLALLALVGIAGSTGLCLRVGAGLRSPADQDRPWRAVLRGGVVMAFVCLLPIVGWVGILLWMLISGCGVMIQLRLPKRFNTAAPGKTVAVPSTESSLTAEAAAQPGD